MRRARQRRCSSSRTERNGCTDAWATASPGSCRPAAGQVWGCSYQRCAPEHRVARAGRYAQTLIAELRDTDDAACHATSIASLPSICASSTGRSEAGSCCGPGRRDRVVAGQDDHLTLEIRERRRVRAVNELACDAGGLLVDQRTRMRMPSLGRASTVRISVTSRVRFATSVTLAPVGRERISLTRDGALVAGLPSSAITTSPTCRPAFSGGAGDDAEDGGRGLVEPHADP